MRAECFKNVRIDQSGSGRDRTRESGQDQEPRYCWVKEGYFKVTELLQHH